MVSAKLEIIVLISRLDFKIRRKCACQHLMLCLMRFSYINLLGRGLKRSVESHQKHVRECGRSSLFCVWRQLPKLGRKLPESTVQTGFVVRYMYMNVGLCNIPSRPDLLHVRVL